MNLSEHELEAIATKTLARGERRRREILRLFALKTVNSESSSDSQKIHRVKKPQNAPPHVSRAEKRKRNSNDIVFVCSKDTKNPAC